MRGPDSAWWLGTRSSPPERPRGSEASRRPIRVIQFPPLSFSGEGPPRKHVVPMWAAGAPGHATPKGGCPATDHAERRLSASEAPRTFSSKNNHRPKIHTLQRRPSMHAQKGLLAPDHQGHPPNLTREGPVPTGDNMAVRRPIVARAGANKSQAGPRAYLTREGPPCKSIRPQINLTTTRGQQSCGEDTKTGNPVQGSFLRTCAADRRGRKIGTQRMGQPTTFPRRTGAVEQQRTMGVADTSSDGRPR